MKNIIDAEFYKFLKRNVFIGILLLSSFSLIYALGVYFKWKFITMTGRLDVISFITAMWSLLTILGIPLILFSFLGASVLGGEIFEKQILLEITKVHKRTQIIVGKFLTVNILLFICYTLNVILSFLFYVLFVAKSSHGYSSIFVFKAYNFHMLIVSLLSVLLLSAIVSISMFFSINYGVIRAVIFSMIFYVVIKMLVNIKVIKQWLPGYYSLVDDADFSTGIVIYQVFILMFFIVGFIILSNKIFSKKQF